MSVKDVIYQALFDNTDIGDEGFTKHDILEWAQEIDPNIRDGANVGFSITALVNDEYIEPMNPGKRPVYYRRIN